MRLVATWSTWDEPDRDIAVAHWRERNISVVFPLSWARHHGQQAMIAHSKDRIAAIEGQAGRSLEMGSVLLAFSRHIEVRSRDQQLNPDVSQGLIEAGG